MNSIPAVPECLPTRINRRLRVVSVVAGKLLFAVLIASWLSVPYILSAADSSKSDYSAVSAIGCYQKAVAINSQNLVSWIVPKLGITKNNSINDSNGDNYLWYFTVYRQMDENERLKFAAIRVTDSYFGGEQSYQVQSMIGDDNPWLFPVLAKVDPRAYGDFCHYQGAPVKDVLGNIGGFSKFAPKIDPQGTGGKVSFRNTYVRHDLLGSHDNVFGIYGAGHSEGARYWMDRLFPALAGGKEPMMSLDDYYDQAFNRLSDRDKTILTFLLLCEPTYDPADQSPLREKMRRQGVTLESLLTRKAIQAKFSDSLSLNFMVRFRDRLLNNLDDLLGHPLK